MPIYYDKCKDCGNDKDRNREQYCDRCRVLKYDKDRCDGVIKKEILLYKDLISAREFTVELYANSLADVYEDLNVGMGYLKGTGKRLFLDTLFGVVIGIVISLIVLVIIFTVLMI